ncbi:hypothetical protein ABEB36_015096 [Hypothenemus hampei]|uniref:Uncharacterized protein n=1 Tax=Hypothenemus hampei TaxID=57062 RepID=A0ABD1E0D0_HYPHA
MGADQSKYTDNNGEWNFAAVPSLYGSSEGIEEETSKGAPSYSTCTTMRHEDAEWKNLF